MRKLTVGFLAAIALLSALTATPATAKPRGVNGQIVFGRDDPVGTRYLHDQPGRHPRAPAAARSGSGLPTGRLTGARSWPTPAEPETGVDHRSRHRGLSRAAESGPGRASTSSPAASPSPDFKRLACAGFGKTDPSLNGIYSVRTSDGGGLRRLTSDTIEDDARRLVARRQAPRLLCTSGPVGPPDSSVGLYVLKINGTGTRQDRAVLQRRGRVVVAAGQRHRVLVGATASFETAPQHDLDRPQRRQRTARDPRAGLRRRPAPRPEPPAAAPTRPGRPTAGRSCSAGPPRGAERAATSTRSTPTGPA